MNDEASDFREKCPILVMPNAGKERVLECINCPVRTCIDDIRLTNKPILPTFLKEVNATIAELEDIKDYIKEKMKQED